MAAAAAAIAPTAAGTASSRASKKAKKTSDKQRVPNSGTALQSSQRTSAAATAATADAVVAAADAHEAAETEQQMVVRVAAHAAAMTVDPAADVPAAPAGQQEVQLSSVVANSPMDVTAAPAAESADSAAAAAGQHEQHLLESTMPQHAPADGAFAAAAAAAAPAADATSEGISKELLCVTLQPGSQQKGQQLMDSAVLQSLADAAAAATAAAAAPAADTATGQIDKQLLCVTQQPGSQQRGQQLDNAVPESLADTAAAATAAAAAPAEDTATEPVTKELLCMTLQPGSQHTGQQLMDSAVSASLAADAAPAGAGQQQLHSAAPQAPADAATPAAATASSKHSKQLYPALRPASEQEQQQQQPIVWSETGAVSVAAMPRGSNNGDFAPLSAASPSGDWRIAVAAHDATHADAAAAVPEEEEQQVLGEEAHQQQQTLPGRVLQDDSVCLPNTESDVADNGSSSSEWTAASNAQQLPELAGDEQLLDVSSVGSSGRTSSWKTTLSDLLYGRFSSSDGSSSSRNSASGQRRSTSDTITAAGKSLQLQPALQEGEEQQITSTVGSSSSKMAARCIDPDHQQLAGEQQLFYVGSVASAGRTSNWKSTLSDLLYGRFSSSDGSSSTSGQRRSTGDAITAAGKSLQLQPILQEVEEQLLTSTSSSSSSTMSVTGHSSARDAAPMQPAAAGKVLGSMPMQSPTAALYCGDTGSAAAAAGFVATQQLKAANTPHTSARTTVTTKRRKGVQSGADKGATSANATPPSTSKTAARQGRRSSSSRKPSVSSSAVDGGVANSWRSYGSRISKVLLLLLLPCVLLLVLYGFQGVNR
jgi:hypothetical protein